MATIRSLGRFPFCVPELPVVDDGFDIADFWLPLGETGVTTTEESFYEAVDVFWRIESWRFEVTSGFAYPDPTVTDFEKTAGQSEKELLLPEPDFSLLGIRGRWYGFQRTYEFGELAGQQESQVYFSFLWGSRGLNVNWPLAFDGTLYYMAFVNGYPDGTQTAFNDRGTITRTGRLEYQITRFGYTRFDEDGNPTFIDPVVWNLKPFKWWKYDPFDGRGPIYDEFTGATLRNPIDLRF